MISLNEQEIKKLDDICLDKKVDSLIKPMEIEESFPDGLKLNEFFIDQSNEAYMVISLEKNKYKIENLLQDMDSCFSLLKESAIQSYNVVFSFNEGITSSEDEIKYSRNDYTIGVFRDTENMLNENYGNKVKVRYTEYLPFLGLFSNKPCHNNSKLFSSLWTLDDIKKANLAIDEITELIKKEKLSPLETIAFISAFAYKNFIYSHDSYDVPTTKFDHHNNIVAAINEQKIRCVGYDQFFRVIVNGLCDYFSESNNELVAHTISLTSKKSGHAVSQAYIRDNKYKIDGNFLIDINRSLINFLKRPIIDNYFYENGHNYITEQHGNKLFVKRSDGNIVVIDKASRTPKTKKNIYVIPSLQPEILKNLLNIRNILDSSSSAKKVYHEFKIVPENKNRSIFKGESNKCSFLHKKSVRSLNLSKLSSSELLALMDKVYDNISNLEIPKIKDIIAKITNIQNQKIK